MNDNETADDLLTRTMLELTEPEQMKSTGPRDPASIPSRAGPPLVKLPADVPPGGIKMHLTCPRCGQRHENVIFRPLTNPRDQHTHWAMCPVLNEPLKLALGGGHYVPAHQRPPATPAPASPAT
jgi:hypothetical protein